nr:hypothetical protein CFP56_07795 [Quercus suber]
MTIKMMITVRDVHRQREDEKQEVGVTRRYLRCILALERGVQPADDDADDDDTDGGEGQRWRSGQRQLVGTTPDQHQIHGASLPSHNGCSSGPGYGKGRKAAASGSRQRSLDVALLTAAVVAYAWQLCWGGGRSDRCHDDAIHYDTDHLPASISPLDGIRPSVSGPSRLPR